MQRGPVGASFSALMVTVGGLVVAVWALFAIEMRLYLPLLLAVGMAATVLLSGVLGLWLQVRHRQLSGLLVSLLAAFSLALLSVTLLVSFAVILLALALLLVVGGIVGLSRDDSRA